MRFAEAEQARSWPLGRAVETCVAAHRDCLRNLSPIGMLPKDPGRASGRTSDDLAPVGRRAKRKKAWTTSKAEVRGDGRTVPKGAVARVRLLEIDAPEREACFADEASARTAALLPTGSRVRTERDIELTDRYDRYLLYVWNARAPCQRVPRPQRPCHGGSLPAQ